MQCELDAETRDELAKLAYASWADAFDTRKRILAETDDGTPDWSAFHQLRLSDTKERLAKAERVRDAICSYSPLSKGE